MDAPRGCGGQPTSAGSVGRPIHTSTALVEDSVEDSSLPQYTRNVTGARRDRVILAWDVAADHWYVIAPDGLLTVFANKALLRAWLLDNGYHPPTNRMEVRRSWSALTGVWVQDEDEVAFYDVAETLGETPDETIGETIGETA